MKRYLVKIQLVFCLLLGGAAELSAEQRSPGEYQVKALFLYNFINFVDWPADSSFSSSPTVNVCIVGDDPFDDALNDIRDERVKGKKVTIRHYRPYDELKGCHLLFIPASEGKQTESFIRSVRDSGVLTVGDTEESARQGTVIGFFIEQKKVRFAVNLEAARRSGLKISAKLLKLSKIVRSAED
jgi:hypothetical protein